MIDRETLKPGFEIPTISRPGDYQYWNRYAGVNYEFAGHHMDDEVAIHEGFEGAIGMGPFITALIYAMLREWIGEDTGEILRVAMQSRRPWIRKRVLTEAGRVTEIIPEDGALRIKLEIWADNDLGERLIIGDAVVRTPLQ